MTRIAVVVNAVGAIAVTTAVLMAHGASDRGGNATDTVIRPILIQGAPMKRCRMAGTPDSIRAFDNGDGTFTLLAREAGSVSRWVISADDFTLLDAGREPDLSAGVGATDVDASEFLGPGWHLRIQPGVIVAERAPEAPAR